MEWTLWHLYLFAAFFIYAGIRHFQVPQFFMKITPPWVPRPELVNSIVGIAEIILGVGLLFATSRSFAACGIILLLIAVFPANLYHHQLARKKGKHVTGTFIRLPFQILFVWWAWQYL